MPPQLLLPAVRLDWDPLPDTASGVFAVVPACVVFTVYVVPLARVPHLQKIVTYVRSREFV